MPARVTTYSASQPGGSQPNQDRFHTDDQFAFVLDGASAVRSQKRDGGWYAEQLSRELRGCLEHDQSRDLRASLRKAIVAAGSMLDAGDGSPSSTIAIAEWSSATLDVLVLGDSVAVVYLRSGVVDVLCDSRLDAIGTELRDAYQGALRGGGGFSGDHRDRVKRLQEEQLRMRNKAGGYWIAADDPAAADEAIGRSFPIHELDAVLLATDGVAEGVLTYQLMNWQDARQRIITEGAEALINSIAVEELRDKDGDKWPRAKRSDDKTVVLIEFGAR